MLESIGWIATALFALSYMCKHPVRLRLLQSLAAMLWIGYGIIIGAAPVIVANLIVALMAGYSAWRQSSPEDSALLTPEHVTHQP